MTWLIIFLGNPPFVLSFSKFFALAIIFDRAFVFCYNSLIPRPLFWPGLCFPPQFILRLGHYFRFYYFFARTRIFAWARIFACARIFARATFFRLGHDFAGSEPGRGLFGPGAGPFFSWAELGHDFGQHLGRKKWPRCPAFADPWSTGIKIKKWNIFDRNFVALIALHFCWLKKYF